MLRNWFLSGLGFAVLLLLYGVLRIPAALQNSSGLIGVLSVLLLYFLLLIYGTKRTLKFNADLLPLACRFGLFTGAIFFIEILLEYVLLPNSGLNTIMGYVEFGSVFFLYFLAGLWSEIRFRKYVSSLLTAFWCALIASLIWYNAVLLIFYLFYHTQRQTAVFQAEGDWIDFRNSGLSNFDAFIMQDFWGAGFYHLLLGPVVAIILGALGGGIGFVFLALKKSTLRSRTPY